MAKSQERMRSMKYVCPMCGWEYDEEAGAPELGIAPGTKFEDLPAERSRVFSCLENLLDKGGGEH